MSCFCCSTANPYNEQIQAEIDAYNVVQDAVELVTVNGFPFVLLSASGMRGFIDFRIDYLHKRGFGLPAINRHNIIKELQLASDLIVDEIKEEISGKIISLMFDTATKKTLAVLGVNTTFMVNDEVMFRTLGVIQINERHTAVNLADLIHDILRKFDISLDQVFSITTDNARNVTNVSKVLNSVAESANSESTCAEEPDYCDLHGDENEEIGAENQAELDKIMNQAAFFENLLIGATANILTTHDLIKLINQVNCGTHTFQLSVNDALKESNADEIIQQVKDMCIVHRYADTSCYD